MVNDARFRPVEQIRTETPEIPPEAPEIYMDLLLAMVYLILGFSLGIVVAVTW